MPATPSHSDPDATESVLLALSTFPDLETAQRISQQLVADKLAACANIFPGIESIYSWKGKLEKETEVLVLFKTTRDREPDFQKTLRSLHPYDAPEIIFTTIDGGSPDYLRWVAENCRS